MKPKRTEPSRTSPSRCPSTTVPPHSSIAGLVFLLLASCTGEISEGGGSTTPGGSAVGDDEPVGAQPAPLCDQVRPPPDSRLVRLSHAQYENTVADLLGLSVEAAREFIADREGTGFDTATRDLHVSERLGRDYQRAAESLADALRADSDALGRIVPCRATERGCARQFVESFGRRAFRRPLSEPEVDAYSALHASAAELYPSGGAFENSVHLVVQAMLQSPDFLYRIELAEDTEGHGVAALTDYEIASRLSFSLWNRMPDDALFEAAARGELRTTNEVRAQARRMLEDPRGEAMLARFHGQWLEADRYQGLMRDPSRYPAFATELGPDLRTELDLFVRDVVVDRRLGIEELLTAPQTFVNARLASIYRLPGSYGESFERVSLDPAQRAGLLTQVGFLASHAHVNMTSPIERGVFVHGKILCTHIPAPPPDADLNIPPPTEEFATTRDRIEAHTGGAACRSCHSIINPLGFAFERYDADGSYRESENGHRVDASGELAIDGERTRFDDAIGLVHRIAKSEQARQCYAAHWLRYAYGRLETRYDGCRLRELAERMKNPSYSVLDLVVDLAVEQTFRQHIVEGEEG